MPSVASMAFQRSPDNYFPDTNPQRADLSGYFVEFGEDVFKNGAQPWEDLFNKVIFSSCLHLLCIVNDSFSFKLFFDQRLSIVRPSIDSVLNFC